jgi:hypothetical protein
MSKPEQDLVLLWYKLYPADDYCTHALTRTSSPSDIPMFLRDAIFSLPNLTDEFIAQRASVLIVISYCLNHLFLPSNNIFYSGRLWSPAF